MLVEVADTERPGFNLTNKLFAVCAVAGLIVSLAGSALAFNEKSAAKPADGPGEKVERTLTVDAEAIITLCV